MLDFGFGLGPNLGVGRRGQAVGCVVGLIDRRGLGFLLIILCLLGIGGGPAGVEFVDAFNDVVEFLLQAIVRPDVEIAAQERVQRAVEILLGAIAVARVIVRHALLVFLFGPGDKIGNRVGSVGLRGLRFLRLRRRASRSRFGLSTVGLCLRT